MMALPIITADQRLREKKGQAGAAGQERHRQDDPNKTLPRPRRFSWTWEAGDLAVRTGAVTACARPPGPSSGIWWCSWPAPTGIAAEAPFSDAHYRHVCERYGDPAQLAKYDCYFVDSITVLARLALIWSKAQPQAISERTGKPDTRGAYGLLGTEMLGALMHLQHARGKHVVFVAILDERIDDFNRKVFVPQIEGAKTAAELPGIVDEVVTLAEIKAEDGNPYRAFVTHTLNPYGYPAKDRSGPETTCWSRPTCAR